MEPVAQRGVHPSAFRLEPRRARRPALRVDGITFAFARPALQDSLHVVPAALVGLCRDLECSGEPFGRVCLVRILQLLGDQLGEHANVPLVQYEDVRAWTGAGFGRGQNVRSLPAPDPCRIAAAFGAIGKVTRFTVTG